MTTLNGMPIIARTKDAIYIRIPRELQKPCDGCECSYCKAHPRETPGWDTLAVTRDKGAIHESTWTVHMPDPKSFLEYVQKHSL